MGKTYEALYEYITGIEIMDTHEHLPAFERMRDSRADVLSEYLSHYYIRDLVSAGLPPENVHVIGDPEIGLKEKWKLAAPYWKACEHTGYGQSLAIAAKDIYGIDRIDSDSIEELNARFMKNRDGAHYDRVLKGMCKIKRSVLDADLPADERIKKPDEKYFIQTNRIDRMVFPKTAADIDFLSAASGVTISRFDYYLAACGGLMDWFSRNSKMLKCTLAYERTLHFAETSYARAEEGFIALFGDDYYNMNAHACDRRLAASKAMQDYMMHYLLGIAQEKGMVLQIHTGIQEGNGNILENSNPSHLNNLFNRYPGLMFDVFHIGYPYANVLGVLAKLYPNVWADMCWSHIVSPVGARQSLREWIQMIPCNKILGFGGDYLFVDGVYGHLRIAQKNIAMALEETVEEGVIDTDAAKDMIDAIMRDNAQSLYGIQ